MDIVLSMTYVHKGENTLKIDYKKIEHHPVISELTELICNKTKNTDKSFFRIEVAYFIANVASNMRAYTSSRDRGKIPINIYTILLATSGYGKNHSIGILERELLNKFKDRFLDVVMPNIAEASIIERARDIASLSGEDVGDVIDRLNDEYDSAGPYAFSFDSGTTPAVKQMRHKLILGNIGALSLVADECYTPDTEILTSEGFKYFQDLTGKELVAQFDPSNRNISYVKPIRYIEKEYAGEVYSLNASSNFNMTVTPNHEILVYTKGTPKFKKVTPNNLIKNHTIPLTGIYVGGDINHISASLRLSLAIQADGSIKKHGVEFGFKKIRKINTLESLLKELDITYTKYSQKSHKDYIFFYISFKKLNQIFYSKCLSEILEDVTKYTANACKQILEELLNWDGHVDRHHRNFRFTNKYKENCEIVQRLAIQAGYKTCLVSNPKKGYEGGYYVTWNTAHTGYAQLSYLNEIRTTKEYMGKVYCVEVPTGAIVIRGLNKRPFIGGNCGSTLLSNTEVLTTYLELFDQGLVKPKLIKNTKENKRNTIIDGKTPANMLLFGTPSKLFNGSNTEDQFMSLLETGFARRCFFALGDPVHKKHDVKDAKQLYLQAINGTNEAIISKWSNYFEELADIKYYKQEITIPDEVAIELLEYQITCEELANNTKGMSELEKTELAHRYFKTIKLAGALTFIDKTNVMTLNHLAQAIKVCEESGKCFKQLLIKDKPYERLAKYIADVGTELTQADLVEALPFYNKTLQAKADMMSLAIAWGYKNNVLIKRSIVDGIEFISGESLEATDLNKLIVSYSNHFAEGYSIDQGSFSELDKLLLADNMNWCSHGFKEDYRLESNIIPGFNLIVLDIDEGQPINWTRSVLSKYTYAIHTTKRHTEEQNRYRLIIPTNYILKLNEEDYVEFMKGIMEFFPINSDTGTAQRSRKWNTNPKGVYYSNEGELFNVLPFIPKTKQNEKYLNQSNELRSVTGLDRWFINQINEGNRNNNLIKYALALVDSGLGLHEVMEKVRLLNTKIASPLDSAEINNTIAKTVSKRY